MWTQRAIRRAARAAHLVRVDVQHLRGARKLRAHRAERRLGKAIAAVALAEYGSES